LRALGPPENNEKEWILAPDGPDVCAIACFYSRHFVQIGPGLPIAVLVHCKSLHNSAGDLGASLNLLHSILINRNYYQERGLARLSTSTALYILYALSVSCLHSTSEYVQNISRETILSATLGSLVDTHYISTLRVVRID
jgi:hypothetical protein